MKKEAIVLYFLSLVILFMTCFGAIYFERKSLVVAKIEVKKLKNKEQKQVKEEKEKEEKDADDENENEERTFEKEIDWNHVNNCEIKLSLVGLNISKVSHYKDLNSQLVILKIFTPPKC